MRTAVEGHADSPLRLLAVTVLTSFDRQDLDELGYSCEVSELVSLLARRGHSRSPLGGAAKGDRSASPLPRKALQAGANYVVMGRQSYPRRGSGR